MKVDQVAERLGKPQVGQGDIFAAINTSLRIERPGVGFGLAPKGVGRILTFESNLDALIAGFCFCKRGYICVRSVCSESGKPQDKP